jgi:hypothetical protein
MLYSAIDLYLEEVMPFHDLPGRSQIYTVFDQRKYWGNIVHGLFGSA